MLEVAANAVVLVIAARVLVDVLRGALFLFASGKNVALCRHHFFSPSRDEDAREATAPIAGAELLDAVVAMTVVVVLLLPRGDALPKMPEPRKDDAPTRDM
jgi:hypothetical protein